jgi:peroxiredoxin Q/BCP
MTLLTIGIKAPAFRLLNQDGQKTDLGSFAGKYLVLYFYPKAMTPGCTTQACGLRDSLAELQRFNAVALGVSPDPVAKLKKFIEKESLNFDLLSDEDHAVAERYGAWGLKKFMGREFMGILRTSFIIGPDGRLAAMLDKFTTGSHHSEVISWLQDHVKV